MEYFTKILKSLGVVAGVLTLFIILDSISYRYSLFYWMCVSVIALPVLFFLKAGFNVAAITAALIGIVLALSPIDITFKSGKFGVNVLTTSYGVSTRPGTVGYGCTVRNRPSSALVFSF